MRLLWLDASVQPGCCWSMLSHENSWEISPVLLPWCKLLSGSTQKSTKSRVKISSADKSFSVPQRRRFFTLITGVLNSKGILTALDMPSFLCASHPDRRDMNYARMQVMAAIFFVELLCSCCFH